MAKIVRVASAEFHFLSSFGGRDVLDSSALPCIACAALGVLSVFVHGTVTLE